MVGNYPVLAKSGGGYVWDDVLEYGYCAPLMMELPIFTMDNDYFFSFESYEDALYFSQHNSGTENPLALILQEEYIDNPDVGHCVDVKESRIAE